MTLILPKSIKLENITKSFQPGIYLIKVQLQKNSEKTEPNKPQFRVYVGQTKDVGGIAHRLGQHISELKTGKHYCKELLRDYKSVSIDNCSFYALDISKELRDSAVRKSRENYYIKILFHSNISLYNKPDAKPTYERSVISINGILYVSISKAALLTGECRSNITRKLNNNANKDYFIVKTFSWRQHNLIKIEDRVYEGYQAIVDAGLTSSVSSIEKRIGKGNVPWAKEKSWHKLTNFKKDEYLIEKALNS